MPTYQYACTACGHRFEAVQSFLDASLTECPACTGALRKVFSSVGIVFKGSGFYRTDSRAGAIANGENGENGSKNGSSEKGGSEKSNSSSDKSSSEKSSSEKSTSSEKSSGSDAKSTSSTASSTSTPAPART